MQFAVAVANNTGFNSWKGQTIRNILNPKPKRQQFN
jgi:hypothetical protein